MPKFNLLLVAMLLSVTANATPLADESSARAFFEAHNASAEAFDVKAAENYSDEAVISARRVGADGQVREMQVSASQWKMLMRTGMELAKQRGDVSLFKDAQFQVDGVRVTIRAKRYSVAKCYHDPEFQRTIERQADGSYLIVAEHYYMHALSACEPS